MPIKISISGEVKPEAVPARCTDLEPTCDAREAGVLDSSCCGPAGLRGNADVVPCRVIQTWHFGPAVGAGIWAAACQVIHCINQGPTAEPQLEAGMVARRAASCQDQAGVLRDCVAMKGNHRGKLCKVSTAVLRFWTLRNAG